DHGKRQQQYSSHDPAERLHDRGALRFSLQQAEEDGAHHYEKHQVQNHAIGVVDLSKEQSLVALLLPNDDLRHARKQPQERVGEHQRVLSQRALQQKNNDAQLEYQAGKDQRVVRMEHGAQ